MTRHNKPGKPLKRRPLIPQRKLTQSRPHPTSSAFRPVALGFGDLAGTVKVNKLITKSVELGQQTIEHLASLMNRFQLNKL